MSDLDKYTQLLREQSQKEVHRMDLAREREQPVGNVGTDAIKQERMQIAARLMKHYAAGALSLEDIAIATSISMSDVIDVAKANSTLKW